MLPGKYYLQEVETQEGYVLYTDLIEIGLDYNEEFEVVVNNKKKEVAEIVKDFENIEVTAGRKETIIENNASETNIEKNLEVKSISNESDTVNVKNNTNIKNIKKLPKTGY